MTPFCSQKLPAQSFCLSWPRCLYKPAPWLMRQEWVGGNGFAYPQFCFSQGFSHNDSRLLRLASIFHLFSDLLNKDFTVRQDTGEWGEWVSPFMRFFGAGWLWITVIFLLYFSTPDFGTSFYVFQLPRSNYYLWTSKFAQWGLHLNHSLLSCLLGAQGVQNFGRLLSLFFPLPISSPLFIQVYPHSDASVCDVLDVFICWTGNILLSYSCSTCNLEVLSWCHDADVTPLTSFYHMWLFSIPKTTSWRDYSFPIEWSYQACQNWLTLFVHKKGNTAIWTLTASG